MSVQGYVTCVRTPDPQQAKELGVHYNISNMDVATKKLYIET